MIKTPTTHVKRTYVPPTTYRRKGKLIKRVGYYRKAHTRKIRGARLSTSRGEKFRKLERKIYAQYRRKGYSEAKAKQIARATAGKVAWRKYGRERMREILRREH